MLSVNALRFRDLGDVFFRRFPAVARLAEHDTVGKGRQSADSIGRRVVVLRPVPAD
jgi:hypothetical protein